MDYSSCILVKNGLIQENCSKIPSQTQEREKVKSKSGPSNWLQRKMQRSLERDINGKIQPALLTSVWQNYDMSEVQVGEALKAAGFSKFDPGRWEDMVEAVVMARNGA